MNVLGIHMLSAYRVELEGHSRPLSSTPAFGGGLEVLDPAAFEAGLDEVLAEALHQNGPPLWDELNLRDAMIARFNGGDAKAPTGNPHAMGTSAWMAYGRETGIWFRLEPSWFGIAEQLDRDWRAATSFVSSSESSPVEGFRRFLRDFARELARLSDLMSRAARTGASDAQLEALSNAALAKGKIGEGKKSDFEKAWKDPNSDLRLGNIVRAGTVVFGGSKGHLTKLGARHKVQQMGAQAADALEQQAQEMGLELYESDGRREERAGAALALHFRRHQLELAHLRGRDPQAWDRIYERRRALEAEDREESWDGRSTEDPGDVMALRAEAESAQR
ncbi:MAG: hypothetical protein AAGD10_20760 [Myxococcota bacterium]